MPSNLDDFEYLRNYAADKLYVHPGKDGAYATMVAANEVCIGEIDVTTRTKLAVSAFHVAGRRDFSTFKITRLKYTRRTDWQPDGHVHFNLFDLSKMKAFLAILTTIDLHEPAKAKIDLQNIHVDVLGAILGSSIGPDLIATLSASPELQNDIYAVAAKRVALAEFDNNLNCDLLEPEWQAFFKRNTWIFGHGLNFVFLERVAKKLEASTTGADFQRSGKRVDALLRTRAEVSQYVLAEIKRSNTDLLKREYRPGCWAVSEELSAAVTQVQKTVFEFSHGRFRDLMKDERGNDVPGEVFAVEPQSYLVIGNMNEIIGNDDKIKCFELYRKNIRTPTILTFDELYHRARCIVENLSGTSQNQEAEDDDEIPF